MTMNELFATTQFRIADISLSINAIDNDGIMIYTVTFEAMEGPESGDILSVQMELAKPLLDKLNIDPSNY